MTNNPTIQELSHEDRAFPPPADFAAAANAQAVEYEKAAADRIGYEPTFFGCDGMDGILGVDGFDTAMANGLMMLCPFSAYGEDETTVTFVTNYKAAFNDETPNQFAADAYDCVYAIYQCVQDGTITPDMSVSDMCDALKGAFTTMTFSGTTGEGQTWDENGMISKEPKVYIIQDGAYVLAEGEA